LNPRPSRLPDGTDRRRNFPADAQILKLSLLQNTALSGIAAGKENL
jgi:hypothetical protein